MLVPLQFLSFRKWLTLNRHAQKVGFKIDKAARETFNMLKPAFEEAAMSKNQVNLIGVTSSKIEWYLSQMLNVQVCPNKTFKMKNTGANCGPPFLCIYCTMSMGRCTVLPQGWHNEELFLHHNTAPAHNALSAQKFYTIMARLLSHTSITPQIYHLVPLCCFLNSNWHWRGGDFMTSEWFQNKCRLQVPVPNRWH